METDISGIYKHWKGNHYIVFGQTTHTESGEVTVVYKNLLDSDLVLYNRPIESFTGLVSVDDEMIPRFEKLSDDQVAELAIELYKKASEHSCQTGGECECGGSCQGSP